MSDSLSACLLVCLPVCLSVYLPVTEDLVHIHERRSSIDEHITVHIKLQWKRDANQFRFSDLYFYALHTARYIDTMSAACSIELILCSLCERLWAVKLKWRYINFIGRQLIGNQTHEFYFDTSSGSSSSSNSPLMPLMPPLAVPL